MPSREIASQHLPIITVSLPIVSPITEIYIKPLSGTIVHTNAFFFGDHNKDFEEFNTSKTTQDIYEPFPRLYTTTYSYSSECCQRLIRRWLYLSLRH